MSYIWRYKNKLYTEKDRITLSDKNNCSMSGVITKITELNDCYKAFIRLDPEFTYRRLINNIFIVTLDKK